MDNDLPAPVFGTYPTLVFFCCEYYGAGCILNYGKFMFSAATTTFVTVANTITTTAVTLSTTTTTTNMLVPTIW